MKKKLKFIIINLLVLIFLLFTIEGVIWFIDNDKLRKAGKFPPSIHHLDFHSGIKTFELNPDSFPTPENGWGRAPEGLEYTNKKPIVIFGCSYAYGYTLEKEQTLSYKLANQIKTPVYNRAFTGWGIQHMLYQSKLEKLYEQIPEPKSVVYVFINDQIRRLYLLTFSEWNILLEEQNLRYKEKNGKLVEIRNINPVFRQIKRLYSVNKLHHFLLNKYLKNPKNKQKAYDFALKHFTEAKNEMQKHWKDTQFIVFFYDEVKNETFKTQLEENGFKIITSSELTDKDLFSEEYLLNNYHPNEKAWDLIVPALSEKI